MRQAERRVVVTGMGMITPVGLDRESTWHALQEGKGGVGRITLFDSTTFPTRIAAEIKDFRLERDLGEKKSERWAKHSRNTRIALAAGQQAMDDSGLLETEMDRARFGVYLGSGEGQQDFPRFVNLMNRSSTGGKVDTRRFTGEGFGTLDRLQEAEQEAGLPASHLASLFGARGPNISCLTACRAPRRLAKPRIASSRRSRCAAHGWRA